MAENESEVFEGADTDKMASNIIERGRYTVETVDISHFVSKNGNKCNKVEMKVETGHKLTDYLICEGKMAWKWGQYLFANGIRQKGRFTVSKERLVGSKCKADVEVKDRVLGDGAVIKENKITGYSAIEIETVPTTEAPEPPADVKAEQEKETEEL